jgi:hypothetical protein
VCDLALVPFTGDVTVNRDICLTEVTRRLKTQNGRDLMRVAVQKFLIRDARRPRSPARSIHGVKK